MTTKRLIPTTLVAALAALALVPGTAPAKGRDGFHATVLSVAPSGDAFTVRRSGGTRITIAITPSTEFERIAGVSALRRGMAIEVKAVRRDGRWVARQVETSGGDDDRGDDDHGGDDHGSGGHGSDD